MRLVLLFASLLFDHGTANEFQDWVAVHGKQYKNQNEKDYRAGIFVQNLGDMMDHNDRFYRGEVTWHRKVTEYYDLTNEEFAELRLNHPKADNHTTPRDHLPREYLEKLGQLQKNSLPDYWNWVDHGAVTSIKNQGHCGSCAAFAATAIVESCFWQARGVLYDDLSEQFLMDCGFEHWYHDGDEGWFGAWGCDGAWVVTYLDYLIQESNGFHQKESVYTYEAKQGDCRVDSDGYLNQGKLTDMAITFYPSAQEIKQAVYISPVATTIDATWLGDYDYGIYDDSRCCEATSDSSCIDKNNHAVTIVGWGEEAGVSYWIVKNSWGDWFGENGFFRIKRGPGLCGFGHYYMSQALCEAV